MDVAPWCYKWIPPGGMLYGARYKNSHLKVQLGFCRHLLNSGRWALLLPLRLAPLLLRGAIETKKWQKLGFGPNRLDPPAPYCKFV